MTETPEPKADRPDWLDKLYDNQGDLMRRVGSHVRGKALPAAQGDLAGTSEGERAVLAAFTAFGGSWKDFRTGIHRQFRPHADRGTEPSEAPESSGSSPQTSSPRGAPAHSSGLKSPTSSGARPVKPERDRAGLKAALAGAASEMTWAALKARTQPAPVMQHDKDLFSIAAGPNSVNLGGKFRFKSKHVADASATSIGGRNVVALIPLVDLDLSGRDVLKQAVADMTRTDAVVRTTALDAALSEPKPNLPRPTIAVQDGVLSADVRDRLAQHNQKIFNTVQDGDQVTVHYYVKMDFAVAGKPAGKLSDAVAPHQDPNPFTFKFKRVAKKKWQEVDQSPPASRRCPGGKEHFKALFKAIGATCEFQKK